VKQAELVYAETPDSTFDLMRTALLRARNMALDGQHAKSPAL
jgi:hypothetical protein